MIVAPGDPGQAERVLIVDPEPIVVELIERRLRAAGFDTHGARSARDALEEAARLAPDVILVATALPDSDGFRLVAELRALPALQGVSIALMAALQRDARSLGRGLELGADDYLRKPIDSVELVARVRSLARLRRQLAELHLQAARLAELNSELERIAIVDPLTGLYNRRYLEGRLAEEVERSVRYQQPLSAIVADVDFFKKVNDAHGHLVGDAVLRAVAAAMQRAIRRVDLLARFGGEEFVLLTPATSRALALIAAERVREAVAETAIVFPGERGDETLRVTVSLGVATLVPTGDLAAASRALLAAADAALYRAKAGGRNRVEADGE